MKIRIKGNTLRYRLSKSEVEALVQNGKLEERTEFIEAALIYTIVTTKENDLTARFVKNEITLSVPSRTVQFWATTDQVAIAASMQLPNDNSLELLLEKDFKCIDADASEDQSDYFENPHLTC